MIESPDPLYDARAWRGDYAASAPQDWATEVLPVQTELQLLDARFRIIWHPKALIARPTVRDVAGAVIRPTVYDERWQVIVQGALDGEDTAIYTLGNELPEKPYRPVGAWLVDFMRQWDAQNVYRAKLMADLIAEHDATIKRKRAFEKASRQEALRRFATDRLKMRRDWVAVPTQLT